jgi:cell division protein FtsA
MSEKPLERLFESESRIIVGLDVGTTKVCALVAREEPGHPLEIVGVGQSPSQGLRKGVVVDIAKTVASISKALEAAAKSAGLTPEHVIVGIAGDHVMSTNSNATLTVRKSGRVIDEKLRDRAINKSLNARVPQGYRVIHAIPREFILDGVDGVLEPLGMSANKIEVKTHIVLGAIPSIANLVNCVQQTGVGVSDIVLEPIASAEAVLTTDERELGTALIDIGGGTTDLAVFNEGNICHTKVLPFGGNHVTRDVAVGLRVSLEEAEMIKVKSGLASRRLADPAAVIKVKDIYSHRARSVLTANLADIIGARMEEMFAMVKRELDAAGMTKLLAGGVVLTGGASQLKGIEKLAHDSLGVPARVGRPTNIAGPAAIIKNSVYATGVGLLLYGAAHAVTEETDVSRGGGLPEIADRIKNWFTETVSHTVLGRRDSKP